jgi:hypothetical protein
MLSFSESEIMPVTSGSNLIGSIRLAFFSIPDSCSN